MTTAHRPTWNNALGGDDAGGNRKVFFLQKFKFRYIFELTCILQSNVNFLQRKKYFCVNNWKFKLYFWNLKFLNFSILLNFCRFENRLPSAGFNVHETSPLIKFWKHVKSARTPSTKLALATLRLICWRLEFFSKSNISFEIC